MAVTILLADDCAVTRSIMRRLIELEDICEVIGEAENGLDAVEKTRELHPDLVIMDINMPVMNGMEAAQQIHQECPETSVVMCSVQGERDYRNKAKDCGAMDYLVKPISTDQLIGMVNNVYSLDKKRQAKATPLPIQAKVEQSRVVTIVSAKGGVGKTTIATNLAAMAAENGTSVCVLDLDTQFGDTAMYMRLSGSKDNLGTLVREHKGFDRETISRYLLQHESGAMVLAAPLTQEDKEAVRPEHARWVLAALKEMFELVIVDTAPAPNAMVFSMLELSDTIGLVSTPSLPVLKNNALLLELLEHMGVQPENIQILLNRASLNPAIGEREVAEVLQREIDWELDEDFAMVDASLNAGVPFSWKQPQHRMSSQITLLLDRVMHPDAWKDDDLWTLFG